MLEIKGYLDMNKYIGNIYYVKKKDLNIIDHDKYEKYRKYRNCYDIIKKQYIDLYTDEDETAFISRTKFIQYDVLNHGLSIKVNENEINKTIADLLNKFLDNSINIEINEDISLLVKLSDTPYCCEKCLCHMNFGYIEHSTIKFNFTTKNENLININEIKKYLNKIAQYRVKFINSSTYKIAAFILPFDNDEMAEIFKRYLAINQIILI